MNNESPLRRLCLFLKISFCLTIIICNSWSEHAVFSVSSMCMRVRDARYSFKKKINLLFSLCVCVCVCFELQSSCLLPSLRSALGHCTAARFQKKLQQRAGDISGVQGNRGERDTYVLRGSCQTHVQSTKAHTHAATEIMRSFMQQQQHGTGIIRKAAAFLPSFPCVGLFYCSTMQQRGCSRIHTEEAAAAALAEKNKRSTGVSPMPYKSTHRGSGNTAVRTKRGEASALKDSSARGSDAPKLDNLTGSRSSCTEDGGTVPSRPLSPLQRRQLLFKHKSAFTLTPQAIRRVKYLLAQCSENQKKSPDGIRISVRRRGCSGYSYTVNYHYPHDEVLTSKSDSDTAIGVVSSGAVGKKRESDVVVVQEGVKVVVDGDALFYVIGTEMDYIVRNVEEKFTFRNPNQKFSCGCEESFMPFDADEQE